MEVDDGRTRHASSSTTAAAPTVLEIDESARDKDGKYVLNQKVKVDSIEFLSEVPKRWPVPPEDTKVAYIINLSEDKKWKEATRKAKNLDHFLKQEVLYVFPPS
jgi:hypothetical protein